MTINRTMEQVQKLWLSALRSGEYKQTNGMLKREIDKSPEFCCLGVLCDLAAKDGGRQWKSGQYAGRYSMPPRYLTGFIGLNWTQACSLAELNDGGESFTSIADTLEEMFKGNKV
jgi:hypothetical protein